MESGQSMMKRSVGLLPFDATPTDWVTHFSGGRLRIDYGAGIAMGPRLIAQPVSLFAIPIT